MKKLSKKVTLLITLISVLVIVCTLAILLANLSIPKTYRQIKNGTFIEKQTIAVELPDATWYLDKRMDFTDRVYLVGEMGWLYDCKLYKDFGWYPDSYLVYSTVSTIRKDRNNDNVRAYYMPTNRNERYLFVWETTDSSILHELAHFADDVQGDTSQSDEWDAIYQAEWTNNEWLKVYKKDNLSEEEQETLNRKEAFAEGFADWYVYTYEKEYFKDIPDEDRLTHLIWSLGSETSEETYPLTYKYMENFYENYQFGEGFLNALSLNYTAIE